MAGDAAPIRGAVKIYVVIGRTGEYSDRAEWPVCWRATLAEAEQVIAVCNKQAREYKRWADSPEGDTYGREGELRRAAVLDPSFACDYTGTTYSVWSICEDPREDKL